MLLSLNLDFQPYKQVYCLVLMSLMLSTQRPKYTDKKENKIFLIYKEIQIGAVAKLYMRKGIPNI